MNSPRHAPFAFPVERRQLRIAGRTLAEIVDLAGHTPCYAYDAAAIREKIRWLRQMLPARVKLHYAIKANPYPALVDDIASRVDGLDTASERELKLALDTGTPPARISIAGPAKSSAELSLAIRHGVTLNVESAGELDRIQETSQRLGRRASVSLRINPDFELKSAGMKMGGRSSPFGVDADQAPLLLDRMRHPAFDFQGLQVYAGSQNLHAGNLMEAQHATFALAARMQEHLPGPMRSLNIGGGFGIPYFPGEQRLDPAPLAENLACLIEIHGKRLGNPDIILELGRYIVGEAGVYICRVVDKKVSRDKTWLIVDGGLHHHLAASGNLGQVIRKNFPVTSARQTDVPTEIVSIAGPLCTPLDLLAENLPMPVTEPGDLIAVLQSGAYGYSASPRHFLSRPEAAEIYLEPD